MIIESRFGRTSSSFLPPIVRFLRNVVSSRSTLKHCDQAYVLTESHAKLSKSAGMATFVVGGNRHYFLDELPDTGFSVKRHNRYTLMDSRTTLCCPILHRADSQPK